MAKAVAVGVMAGSGGGGGSSGGGLNQTVNALGWTAGYADSPHPDPGVDLVLDNFEYTNANLATELPVWWTLTGATASSTWVQSTQPRSYLKLAGVAGNNSLLGLCQPCRLFGQTVVYLDLRVKLSADKGFLVGMCEANVNPISLRTANTLAGVYLYRAAGGACTLEYANNAAEVTQALDHNIATGSWEHLGIRIVTGESNGYGKVELYRSGQLAALMNVDSGLPTGDDLFPVVAWTDAADVYLDWVGRKVGGRRELT